jgi:RHS repeat-associated protein
MPRAVHAAYTLVRTLASPNAGGDDQFGYRVVALGDGQSVLVSAPLAPDAQPGSGAVYRFQVTTGAQTLTVPNPFPGAIDAFGFASAVVGANWALGAMLDDSPGANDTGAVYTVDASTGALLQTFAEPQPPVADTSFGWAVAALGSDVLVGTYRGGVAYRIDGATGVPTVTYADPTPTSGEKGFGTAIAQGAGLVYVGHPEDGSGVVYVFDAASGVLQRTLEPASGDVGGLGTTLLVSGTTVVVGAPGTAGGDGAAYRYDGTTGTVLQAFPNPSPTGADSFGVALALLGADLVIGAGGDDLTSGAVYVLDGTTGAVEDTIASPVSGGGIFGSALATFAGTIVTNGLSPDASTGTVYVFTNCGDGTPTAGEQCDDGNTTSGDGCSATCQSEGGGTTSTSTTTSTTTTTLLPPDPSTVAPPLDPTVPGDLFTATAFLYTGATPIQTGVAPGTIDPRRVAVLRGRARTRDGDPLPGVTITVLGHPELGQTLTRLDGRFDLVVNGGGPLTVAYAATGRLPAQRRVEAPWQQDVDVPDVVLVVRDPQVTAIDLLAAIPMQVARGSLVVDDDGSRQATVLIPQGTQADLVFADGSTEPTTMLHLRATEYSVGPTGPAAMPAALPPATAYTYAVELGADEADAAGAVSVAFDSPIVLYVENFLGFPVGGIVPVGVYDNRAGAWMPSDNGRVVAVVGVAAGVALLDTTGDGIADDAATLAALGITDAERATLGSLYAVGQSLWRAPIPHLSPWDLNWPSWPAAGADYPGQPTPQDDHEPDDPCQYTPASVIGAESRCLGEVVPVVGAPFALHYKNDRVPGYLPKLTIPLSGAAVPGSLNRIELETNVAGQRTTSVFPAAPGQSTVLTWDGRDAYGRAVQGTPSVSVTIGYVYDAVYRLPDDFPQVFASAEASGAFLIDVARSELTLYQTHRRLLSSAMHVWDARGQVGGWSPSIHHVYDPIGQILYLGDGSRRSARGQVVQAIGTLAGTGVGGFSGDGGPAAAAQTTPRAVTTGPDGSLYIAGHQRVRRIAPDGVITTIAGTGTAGFSGDGGPATAARLNLPIGLALAPDGSLYVADTNNNRIRRVAPDGTIATVAGTGVAGFSGDGGLATAAALWGPRGLALGPDGSLYVSDTFNNRIRRIAPDGTISTAAGDGGFGASGDGGPATQADLGLIEGLAASPDGRVYLADDSFHRVRRIDPDGTINTVAGGLIPGFAGDGGPATSALLRRPLALSAGADGSVFVAELTNARIRRVGPEGTITTFAGGGGNLTDGWPATASELGGPAGVALSPDGRLAIADTFDARVRGVDAPLPGFSLADQIIPSEDGREIYVFTSTGRHLRTLDALTAGIRYEFGYDTAGRLITITDGDGNATTVLRDTAGAPSAIVAPGGQVTQLTVDANGYLASIRNPAAETTLLTSTPTGLLTTLRTPRGHTYGFTYDAQGRLDRDDDPAGGFKQLTRTGSPEDYTVALTTAEGRETTYHVEAVATGGTRRTNTFPSGAQSEVEAGTDGIRMTLLPSGLATATTEGPDPRFGLLAATLAERQTSTPGGLVQTLAETRTAVTAPGNLLDLTSASRTLTVNGLSFEQTYDGPTRTQLETTPEGRVRTTVLDPQGRVASTQVAGLAPVTFTRNGTGLLTAITEGTGPTARTTTLAYDARRRLQAITDPIPRTVSFTYDDADRVVTQTFPDAQVVSFGYDASGNVTTVTPPSRPDHAFGYTPVDLEQSYTPPAIGGPVATSYTYNLDRQLTQILRPDGEPVTFAYEPTGGRLLTRTTFADAVTFGYDPVTGNLTSLTSTSGEDLAYTYDGSLVTSATWSGPVAGSVGYDYDTFLRVSATDVNGANALGRGYDLDGLLTQTGSLTLTRHAQHGLVSATSLGVVADSRAYNAFGEPDTYTATANGSPALSLTYGRDTLGRIVEKTESVLGGASQTTTYGYDERGRLETVTTDGTATVTYAYDANGNRLSRTPSGGSAETGTYDDQDRLLTYDGAVYTYTANGELATKTEGTDVTTYAYDALGNLRAVTLPDGTLIGYVIDPENRRVGKTVNGTLVQGFLYEDQLRIAVELDGNGDVVSRFVYGTRVNIPEYMIKDGSTYRILTDHLGSPRLVINTATGSIAQRMGYDEFGRVTTDTNPGFQPFGFAGGLYDRDIELVRFGARDYDPRSGRWVTKDPIGFFGGDSNWYAYVRQDPINGVDPSGLQINPWGDWNTKRNRFNKCPRRSPDIAAMCQPFDEADPFTPVAPAWLPDDPGTSRTFHGYDQGYRTFRRLDPVPGYPNASSQCTYDPFGNLVDDPPFMGTFDYSNPGADWLGHIANDVLPGLLRSAEAGLTTRY